MLLRFTHTTHLAIPHSIDSDFYENLPEVIRKNTDWDYSCQLTNSGCLLKPTFRTMPYRNSFVPEIEIVASPHGNHTMLHLIGRPVQPVRVFMTVYLLLLAVTEAVLLILALTSRLNGIFPSLLPVVMGISGYLLCNFATKSTFRSVAAAIQQDFP